MSSWGRITGLMDQKKKMKNVIIHIEKDAILYNKYIY